MFKILEKKTLAKGVIQMTIEAPLIALKARPGQFIVLIVDEQGERIPLTLADWDKDLGTISIIFQQLGFTTRQLGSLAPGGSIVHILGPLGHPTDIKDLGEVYCIAGGVGIAELYPVARAFKEARNRVTGILGARTKELVILEPQMQKACDELFIATDDGSYGKKGFVTDSLKDLFEVIEKSTHTKYPALVYTIGPVAMMKAVAEMTREAKIKTIASVNPIMVDATGMCGACRCTVAGKTVFGCCDGPDFDAHTLDFDELSSRLEGEKGDVSIYPAA